MNSVNFDRAADFYDATRGFPNDVAPHIGTFIAEQSRLSSHSIVLEIGIGTGRIALPLAPHVQSITGVDISHSMMKVLLDKRDSESIFPVLADGHDLPYQANCFDAVAIIHVLHLVPDPVKILRDVQRVLKPNGYLLHCFGARDNGNAHPVAKAWNSNRPPRKRGYKWSQTAQALDNSGWTQEKEVTYSYAYTQTPQEILDAVQNRVWSSLWDTTDTDLAPAISAITRAVEEHCDGNFYSELTRHAGLTMQILRPLV